MKNYFLFLTILLFIAFYSYSCKEKKTSTDKSNHFENKKNSNDTITHPQFIESNSENIDTFTTLYDVDLLNTKGNIKSVSIAFYSATDSSGFIIKNKLLEDSTLLNLIDAHYSHNKIGIEYKRTFKKNIDGKLSEISKFYSDGSIKKVNYFYNKNEKLINKKTNIPISIDRKGDLGLQNYSIEKLSTNFFNLRTGLSSSTDTFNTIYKYNKDGLLIKKINPFPDEVFITDINLHLLDINLYFDFDVNYVIYNYNKNKQVEETKCYDNKDNLSFILRSDYDKRGNLIKEYDYTNNKIPFENLIEYSYFKDNKRASVWYGMGAWPVGESYDKKGKLIEFTNNYENEFYPTYYKYDINGNLLSTYENYMCLEENFYKYNKNNDIVCSENINYEEGQFDYEKYIYKYNNRNLLTELSYNKYPEEEIYTTIKEKKYIKGNYYFIKTYYNGNINECKYKIEDILQKDEEFGTENGLGGYAEFKGDTIFSFVSSNWILKNSENPKESLLKKFEYNSYGNLIKEKILKNNKPFLIIEKEIEYFH